MTHSLDPSPAIHTLLMRAAHRREAYLWRRVVAISPERRSMSLADVRRSRKYMRHMLEQAALRIWHTEELGSDWNVWLKHACAAAREENPNLKLDFGGAL